MTFSNLFSRYDSRYSSRQNGITLVALVVTIVVLLILSGITITVLFGDNGIISQAQKAKTETERDQADTENGISNLTDQMLQAIGEPITKKEHTAVNLTAGTSENGKGYTWNDLYNVSKAISKTTVAEDVREVTVNLNGTNYTVGIGDEATVYYDGETDAGTKKVRLIGFNHDIVAESGSKAGMTFEFVDTLGTHNMNSTNADTSTNTGGWAASEMREYLNGYRTSPTLSPTPTPTTSPSEPEYQNIKETSEEGAKTLKIQRVIKDYIPTYYDPSTAQSEDYLWLLSCAEIWSDGNQATGKGYTIGVEGSQYAFYKDISGLEYNKGNDATGKPETSSRDWWLRSPRYARSDGFCYVASNRTCGELNYYSYGALGVAPGFCI